MKSTLVALTVLLLALRAPLYPSGLPAEPSVKLCASLLPSPIKPLAAGMVKIIGETTNVHATTVRVRVTTSLGSRHVTEVKLEAGRFVCRFPQDFPGGPKLSPTLLYVDATDASEFDGDDLLQHQAEALVIVTGEGPAALPDLPLPFTDDFVDTQGKKDTAAEQWPRQRTLVNLFFRSRAAKLMRLHRPDFDLARPEDFAWFKENATLYDFDHRDRDWSQPLGNRVARGFWQAMWNRWFNASNDHPWDGNAANDLQSNYRPYTFANDTADIIVLYQMLRRVTPGVADNRDALVNEALANLLAMQHRSAENFALREASGNQQHYTAGAFRYGLFETGEWLTEGKGWFANPAFRDFEYGGVLNGRCVWALGESLKADPNGPFAAKIREAIPLTLRFCLHDGLRDHYTRLTRSGLPYWGPAGEHGYLLMGMLAILEAAPGLAIQLSNDQPSRPLREICVSALNALTEITQADGTWSPYPNADAVNIIALSAGARILTNHSQAQKWTTTASRAADVWLATKPLADERTAPTPHFGMRKDGGTTFYLGKTDKHPHLSLYVGGHWIHALASLHALTHESRYADRAHALLAYYCGDNPLHTRILNELGSVNNRVTDRDNDGIEDELRWNAYPESTAFVQIGLLHLLGKLQ